MIIRFNFTDKIPAIFRNKYVLTIIIFFVWVLLLDSNNLITRYKEMKELNKLKVDREYYIKRIDEDKQNLEKFAREQYRMKKPDEDLYIILTPSEDRKNTRKNR